MAAALTVLDVQKPVRRKKSVLYSVVLSGSYSTGGDTLNLNGATSAKLPGELWSANPAYGKIIQGFAGYDAEIVKGTNATNWKLKLFTSANTETTAAAYNAALTGDTNLMIEVFGDF